MIAKHKLLSHNFYRQQMNRTTGEATAEQKKRLTRLFRRTSQRNYLKVVWNTSDMVRDVHLPKKKNGKMWEFFPNRGPPPIPLFGNFFPILPFIFGRSPMLNTVKNGCGIRVDHPPCFFKIPTFSRFFLPTSLLGIKLGIKCVCVVLCVMKA